MRLYKTGTAILVETEEKSYQLPVNNWDHLINQPALFDYLVEAIKTAPVVEFHGYDVSVPIGSQEVWAAGVTYLRSKNARMEESKDSGGATFYDKVYEAERPEIFFKSNPAKVIPSGGKVRLRKDSTWNVPEPELTLVANANAEIVGYTIGNDMSSRSIEGENPLYLPQAKMYDGSASIGPCVLVTNNVIDPSTTISITITRDETLIYEGAVQISKMKRKHTELVEFLYREYSFPVGAYLMTGTCLVPSIAIRISSPDFNVKSGDEIRIAIEGIGELVNTVE